MKKHMKKKLRLALAVIVAIPLIFGAFMGHADAGKKATVFNPQTNDRKAVRVGDPAAFDGGYILEQGPRAGMFGVAAGSTHLPLVVADFETSLQSKIAASDTTMTLVNGTDDAGNALSGYYGFTIDAGSSSQEYVIANCVATACSSMTRGISVKDGQTSVSALKFSHRRGASVKITDHPSLTIMNQILNGNDGVPDTLYYDTHPTFTTDTQIVDKKYADDLSYNGAPDASSTVKGVSEEATQAEIDAGTAIGGTGARLYINPALLGVSIYATRLPSVIEKEALIGTSGTPSSSNKFVTNDDTATAATASKVVRRGASGDITVPTTPISSTEAASKSYVDTSTGRTAQEIPYFAGTTTIYTTSRTTSTPSGDAMFLVTRTGTTTQVQITRFQRTTNSGYAITHQAIFDNVTTTVSNFSITVAGSYLYLFEIDGSANKYARRYLAADLSGVTSITVSGTTYTEPDTTFSDGTNIYIGQGTSGGDYQYNKYSISGTTITFVSTITFTGAGDPKNFGAVSDGTYVYMSGVNTNSFTVQRYNFTGGAALANSSAYLSLYTAYPNTDRRRLFLYKSDTLGIAYAHTINDPSAVTGSVLKLDYIPTF